MPQFDCHWLIGGNSSGNATLQALRRSDIYQPQTNTLASALCPDMANQMVIVNENMIGGFPGFNQSGGGPDGPLTAAGWSVPCVFDFLGTLGLSTTALSIAGSPNLVQIGSTGKYRMPQQGLAWMASYNYWRSGEETGKSEMKATYFVDEILNPTLDYYFNSMPGVAGWLNTLNGGALGMSPSWVGTVDLDCESWLPKMFLPADNVDPNSSAWFGYNMIPPGGIFLHDQYFVMWAMAGNFPVAAKRLPASHFANCPNPFPLTSMQECFDTYWNLVDQIYEAFAARLHAKAENARLQIYNVPVDQTYYESAYYDWLVDQGTITQAQADTFKQSYIDKYKRMYSDPLVVSAMSHVQDYAASWYWLGTTAPQLGGNPSGTPPYDVVWSWRIRNSHFEQRAKFMRWFNTEGPGRNKPSRVYLQLTHNYGLDDDTSAMDGTTAAILFDKIKQASFTGAINWGYTPGGASLNAYIRGTEIFNPYLRELRWPTWNGLTNVGLRERNTTFRFRSN